MRFIKIQLKLENGETVTCSVAGQGARIGFIGGGPGSFYFNGLSLLEHDYTFVTCDFLWTYGKSHTLNEKSIQGGTKENICEREHFVVNALKRYFNVTEIDGFGFSAPGALLFEQALRYPKDFHCIIGTGVGLIELDATFKKTTDLFYRVATEERKRAFESYQTRYTALQSAISSGNVAGNSELNRSFDLKPTTKLPLKPHKKFVAETLAMAPKLIYQLSNPEKSYAMIIGHWKHNPFGEHLDKHMQEHFFREIYPQVNSFETLITLAKQKRNILLVYGREDYITPLPQEVLEKIRQQAHINLEVLDHAAHMPYLEAPNEYANLIRNFSSANKCVVSAQPVSPMYAKL